MWSVSVGCACVRGDCDAFWARQTPSLFFLDVISHYCYSCCSFFSALNVCRFSEVSDERSSIESSLARSPQPQFRAVPQPVKIIRASATIGHGMHSIKEIVDELLLKKTEDRVQQTLRFPSSGEHIGCVGLRCFQHHFTPKKCGH